MILHPGRVGRPFVTILRYNRPYWAAYLAGFALAAVFSLVNLAMPMVLGHVVDFLDFHAFGYHWPAFNVADMAVSCGAIALAIILELDARKEKAAAAPS